MSDSMNCPSMNCPQCGGELPPNFPPGVCPACLLRQGMSPSTIHGGSDDERGAGGSNPRRHWTPPTPAELAPKFPQLEIVELLGQGGMGAVYKVRQRDLDRWAALKILPGDVADDPNFAERFQREARALAQLGHQHIVIVYEFGQRDGVYFLLMEYVDGVTLRQASRAGQITTQDALGIVTQSCDALQFAHEEGVVHRDIKPENILIDKRGRVKIADFGLAKLLDKPAELPSLTGTHQVMGTPVYMAPEQMEGTKGVDHRADIFSLGVVFYELLTGELPLGRFAPPSQKYSLDVRLDDVVLRTLEKEPSRRYQQASDVKCDVETIRSQPAGAGRSAGEPSHERRLSRQRWSWTRVALIVLCCLPIFCVFVPLWVYQATMNVGEFVADRFDDQSPETVQKQEATRKYLEALKRQRIEQQRQEQERQQQFATRDPNELNAVLQFTAEGVRLHPNFGTDVLSAQQRRDVERIMNARHREYLVYEGRATKREPMSGGYQVVTIERFDQDASTLENDFWTDVDSALPVVQQRFLRQHLPLYADDKQALAIVSAEDAAMSGPAGGGSSAMGSMAGSGYPGGGGLGGPIPNPLYLRYPQLFGWKQSHLPLRISIGRRGKWFVWHIQETGGGASGMRSVLEDKSDAPELPAGLKRFWLDESNSAEPLGAPDRFGPTSISGDGESHDYIAWTKTGEVRLSSWFARSIKLEGERLAQVNAILTETWKKYISLETKHTEYSTGASGEVIAVISPFDGERKKLEAAFWEQIDALVDDPISEALHTSEFTMLVSDSAVPSLFGWGSHTEKIKLTIWKKGDWFHWRARNKRDSDGLEYGRGEGDAASLPPEMAHYWAALVPVSPLSLNGRWRIRSLVDGSVINQSLVSESPGKPLTSTSEPKLTIQENSGLSLAEQLLELDRLRAADKTPWDEVEKQANELLDKYTSFSDKGRIHWMAAHVYGQSDIRGHGADVIRHAKEALKYERDPVQRGWLYMYLGDATGLMQRREEAARWYLKGYFELLAFNLPEQAPELPSVGKFRGVIANPSDNEADSNLIVFEVLQAAEVKARKDAELIRDLVSRRNIYIGQLQTLFGRQYIEDSDEATALKRLATEILRDEDIVTRFIQAVWPDSIPKI